MLGLSNRDGYGQEKWCETQSQSSGKLSMLAYAAVRDLRLSTLNISFNATNLTSLKLSRGCKYNAVVVVPQCSSAHKMIRHATPL